MSCFSHLPLPPLPVLPSKAFACVCGVCVAQHKAQHRPRRVCIAHGQPLLPPPSPLSSHTKQTKVSLHGDDTTKQEAEASSRRADGVLCRAWPTSAQSNEE